MAAGQTFAPSPTSYQASRNQPFGKTRLLQSTRQPRFVVVCSLAVFRLAFLGSNVRTCCSSSPVFALTSLNLAWHHSNYASRGLISSFASAPYNATVCTLVSPRSRTRSVQFVLGTILGSANRKMRLVSPPRVVFYRLRITCRMMLVAPRGTFSPFPLTVFGGCSEQD